MFVRDIWYKAAPAYLQWAIGTVAAIGMAALLLLTAQAQTRPQTTPARPARTVLVMGDSLSAAYGLPAAQGWVALTAERIKSTHPGWRVVNASISGETTAGGAARIEAEMARHQPAIVVIELGANDGLRGLPLSQTRTHLAQMIQAAQKAKARVLLIGMRIPPNYGPDYTRGFEANFTALATQYKLPLLPFLLEPIAQDRANFQNDNLHPVASAQPKLRDHVWSQLAPMLK